MSDKQQAGSLLKMAGNDLAALEGMQSSIQFSDEIFGFHAQQVIEKCCKAWIALLGKKYPFTHDVSMLLKVLEENDCSVSEYWEFAEMTAFAMNIRYEGTDETALPLDRDHLIKTLNILFESVKKMID
jgi:HEPN domain-containing protein